MDPPVQVAQFFQDKFPAEVQQHIFRDILLACLEVNPRVVEVLPYVKPKLGEEPSTAIDLTTGDDKHLTAGNSQLDAISVADEDEADKTKVIDLLTPEPTTPKPKWIARAKNVPCKYFLSLCSSSRFVLLQHYSKGFHPTLVKEITAFGGKSQIFFNFETDLFYISHTWNGPSEQYMWLYEQLKLNGGYELEDIEDHADDETHDKQLWKQAIWPTIFTEEQMNDKKSLVRSLKKKTKHELDLDEAWKERKQAEVLAVKQKIAQIQ